MLCHCSHEDCGQTFEHLGAPNETAVCPHCGRQQRPERALAVSIDDVVRAHDLLVQVICGEVKLPDPPTAVEETHMRAQADVLCWLLGHAHNRSFGANLAMLREEVEAAGYRLVGPETS